MKLFNFRKKHPNKLNYNLKKNKQFDLIIYDDIYPHPISGFREEEFTKLLLHIPDSKIIINPKTYAVFNATKEDHKNDIKNLESKHPELKGKIVTTEVKNNINTKLFYCVFLNNIYEQLEQLEHFKIPFAFTLYPGGGFYLNDEESDNKLKRVLTSKYFRGIIVTQHFTYNYIINKKWCEESKIKLIFGCVVPQQSLEQDIPSKWLNNNEKDTFDICFCAAKYTSLGQDKGYDIFIEAISILSKTYKNLTIHIIGGFDEETINVSNIDNKFIFYGYQNFEALSSIFEKIDVFVSPNKPFVLHSGGFDGFPLGTAIEAALNGVALILSDELNENTIFTPEEIIIIKPNTKDIVNHIGKLISSPSDLKKMAKKGREKFKKVYSNSQQITPRINFLKEMIHND